MRDEDQADTVRYTGSGDCFDDPFGDVDELGPSSGGDLERDPALAFPAYRGR